MKHQLLLTVLLTMLTTSRSFNVASRRVVFNDLMTIQMKMKSTTDASSEAKGLDSISTPGNNDGDNGSDNGGEARRKKKPVNSSRFRQHVNPLASRYQQPRVPSPSVDTSWLTSNLSSPSNPYHLDIGCAKGTFCLSMSPLNPSVNYLGLEIRDPVVEYALDRRNRRKLDNCHFVSCNANVDLERVLEGMNAVGGLLKTVTIQFPDPHFKEKHKKRRVVVPELVRLIGESMEKEEGVVYLASDVKEVLDEMREEFNNCDMFEDTVEGDGYLEENVNEVPTERELSVLKDDKPVWRASFRLRR
ncbi:hypothetical protein TrST_g6298 [Triparma strigata]|uniref:tRNA (guanine(46)-N(7))-methyltransferase n=1 Tax=Triparma strigata TaxID=1606541 RepID=A0A9W7EXX6_9STRA|nr:hypothetical protein TrST_g6298 [Triparma strigata]